MSDRKRRGAKPSPHAAVTSALTEADYARLAEFRYLLRRFLMFSEEAAVAAGLTTQQHQALLAIKGFTGGRPVTVGMLAERLGIRHHSAVGLVDRLAAKGLVRRGAGSDDRRQVPVVISADAERRLAELSLVHRDELHRLAPLLGSLLSELAPRAADNDD